MLFISFRALKKWLWIIEYTCLPDVSQSNTVVIRIYDLFVYGIEEPVVGPFDAFVSSFKDGLSHVVSVVVLDQNHKVGPRMSTDYKWGEL